jgi:hypothetical protein
MSQPCRPLKDVLAEIADPRQARQAAQPGGPAGPGPWDVVWRPQLQRDGGVGPQLRAGEREVLRVLGVTRPPPPCAATVQRVLRRLDRVTQDVSLRCRANRIAPTCLHQCRRRERALRLQEWPHTIRNSLWT